MLSPLSRVGNKKFLEFIKAIGSSPPLEGNESCTASLNQRNGHCDHRLPTHTPAKPNTGEEYPARTVRLQSESVRNTLFLIKRATAPWVERLQPPMRVMAKASRPSTT